MADRMVDDGYLALGYEYLIIDDCWSSPNRDANNRLQANPKRFPSGMKKLAHYIHSRGLKFGIYADYGTKTCGGYPGSMNYLQIDAMTFAEWEIDYLKVDGCYADLYSMNSGYPWFGYYLRLTKRPIVYSCSWPAYQLGAGMNPNYEEISKYCNLWRNFGDINNEIKTIISISELLYKYQDRLSSVQGPGSWNDQDQLVVGNPNINESSAKTQMALWSIMATPLIMSADLRTIEAKFYKILKNKNLIAINQDRLGKMGKKIAVVDQYVHVWAKPLESNKTAFVCVNFYQSVNSIKTKIVLKSLGLTHYKSYNLYETFSGNLIGTYTSNDSVELIVRSNYGVVAFWAEHSKFSSKLTSSLTIFK